LKGYISALSVYCRGTTRISQKYHDPADALLGIFEDGEYEVLWNGVKE